MDREIVYRYLPVITQNVLCSIEGWRINKTRYNMKFLELLEKAKNRTFLSYNEICDLRNRRLKDFIVWSYKTVPYYRDLFNKLGFHPADFKEMEDLKKLPILRKEQIQDNLEDFVSDKIPRRKRSIAHTSGSTGGGLRFATTLESIQEQFAVYWRFLGWHGLGLNTWRGYFGGRSIVPAEQKNKPFWRYNLPGKQIIFSGYHISYHNLPDYIAQINKCRSPWLIGYPSLITLLADYLLNKNETLRYKLQGIALSSENLMPLQIKKIEKAFGVKPIQEYGQAEAVANFSECERGNLHVDEDFSAVEFIPEPHDDHKYRVVGTNFSNMLTPLLRYDTDDIVSLNNDRCDCGRPGRLVGSVDGRKEDYVILRNGVRLGRMDHVFKDMVNIRESQFYQKIAGYVEVRVVKGTKYSKSDEAKLASEIKKRAGDGLDIKITYVEQLHRTARGKLRLVVSDIKEQ